MIGTPEDWPSFDSFERIDRLPSTPGEYVLLFEADYPEGTAMTARLVQVVEAGALQLVLTEGGEVDGGDCDSVRRRPWRRAGSSRAARSRSRTWC